MIFVHDEEDRIGAVVEAKEIVDRIRLSVAGGMEQKRQEGGTIIAHCAADRALVYRLFYFCFAHRIAEARVREYAHWIRRLAHKVSRQRSEAAFAERHFSTLEQFYLLRITFIFYILYVYLL